MSNQPIEQIQLSLEQAKETIQKAKDLEVLRKSPEFKRIFLDGYFNKEALRLVFLKSDFQAQRADIAEAINKDLYAIGALRAYLVDIDRQAQLAQKAIEDDEAELEELREEEAAE